MKNHQHNARPDHVVMRVNAGVFRRIALDLKTDSHLENLVYTTYFTSRLGGTLYLLVTGVIRVKGSDYEYHSPSGASTTDDFKDSVCGVCIEGECDPLLIRRLPTTGLPQDSDSCEWKKAGWGDHCNSVIEAVAPYAVIAFDRNLESFHGHIWDKASRAMCTVSEVQVLGRGGQILTATGRQVEADTASLANRDANSRHASRFSASRHVLIAGVGSIGAKVVQAFSDGDLKTPASVTIIDEQPLTIEDLPHIAYASKRDVGSSRAAVAANYLRSSLGGSRIETIEGKINHPRCREPLARTTIMFGCGADEGSRVVLNQWSVWYMCPYIEIAIDGGRSNRRGRPPQEVCGCVRVILPGSTACLVCREAYDPAQAGLDLMSSHDRDAYDAVGCRYSPSRHEHFTAHPHLAGLAADRGIRAFQDLIEPRSDEPWDDVEIDPYSCESFCSITTPNPGCPLCAAIYAQLGIGMPRDHSNDQDQATESNDVSYRAVLDGIGVTASMPAEDRMSAFFAAED
jgi:hypothetical protein